MVRTQFVKYTYENNSDKMCTPMISYLYRSLNRLVCWSLIVFLLSLIQNEVSDKTIPSMFVGRPFHINALQFQFIVSVRNMYKKYNHKHFYT